MNDEFTSCSIAFVCVHCIYLLILVGGLSQILEQDLLGLKQLINYHKLGFAINCSWTAHNQLDCTKSIYHVHTQPQYICISLKTVTFWVCLMLNWRFLSILHICYVELQTLAYSLSNRNAITSGIQNIAHPYAIILFLTGTVSPKLVLSIYVSLCLWQSWWDQLTQRDLWSHFGHLCRVKLLMRRLYSANCAASKQSGTLGVWYWYIYVSSM